jgi:hypothetical protein
LEPDLLRQPFGGRTLGGSNDVCIVIKGDLRVPMPHQSRDDVNGRSRFEQFGCRAVSETMDPNMDLLLGLDAELGDRTVYSVGWKNCPMLIEQCSCCAT